MEYIVRLQQENIQRIAPYIKKSLGEKSAVLELNDEEVAHFKKQVDKIEPNFSVSLGNIAWQDLGSLKNEKIIVVTMGKELLGAEVNYTYHLGTHEWKEVAKMRQGAMWIHCYSEKTNIEVSECLIGLKKCYKLAELVNRPLIILGNIKSQLPYFKSHSLAEEIAETFLKKRLSLMILQGEHEGKYSFHKAYFNKAHQYIMCTNDNPIKLQEKIRTYLDSSQDTRQSIGVYKDIFYEQIPPMQKIYMPINPFIQEDPTYYKEMGLNAISLGQKYMMLYDEKQKLDNHTRILEDQVLPNFENPILTKSPLTQMTTQSINDNQIQQPIEIYKGEGVYIGIITEEEIDYTRDSLRDEQGETRVAAYWIQEDGELGTYYNKNQVNIALTSNDPNQIVPLKRGESYTTTLLEIAGGKVGDREAPAIEAEFVVAKIKTAPKTLQAIYGGSTQESAVLMPDLIIAAYKLFEIARINHKPIVLIIPYNTNLSCHDGTGIYEGMLREMSRQPGCSIVIPTGEEGNKAHHQNMITSGESEANMVLRVDKMTESLVGAIYLSHISISPVRLYTPMDGPISISLDEEGVYSLVDGTIYTTGIIQNYQNGAQMIQFRIVGMKQGDWKITYLPTATYNNPKADIWLAQQELNPYVRLVPASPFMTIGSNAAIEELISVGGYDQNNLVPLASSGRGYNWEDQIVPFCMTLGKWSVFIDGDESYDIEGSTVAASFLAGAIALIYEKQIKEVGRPYANSLLMKNLILSGLSQFSAITYPNPSQGNGVLRLRDLSAILSTVY